MQVDAMQCTAVQNQCAAVQSEVVQRKAKKSKAGPSAPPVTTRSPQGPRQAAKIAPRVLNFPKGPQGSLK